MGRAHAVHSEEVQCVFEECRSGYGHQGSTRGATNNDWGADYKCKCDDARRDPEYHEAENTRCRRSYNPAEHVPSATAQFECEFAAN